MMSFVGIKRLDWTVTAACLCLIGYFSLQAFVSPDGFTQLTLLQSDLARKQNELRALTRKQAGLERRAASLRPESLDPDMLDEVARSELGLAGANDRIVIVRP